MNRLKAYLNNKCSTKVNAFVYNIYLKQKSSQTTIFQSNPSQPLYNLKREEIKIWWHVDTLQEIKEGCIKERISVINTATHYLMGYALGKGKEKLYKAYNILQVCGTKSINFYLSMITEEIVDIIDYIKPYNDKIVKETIELLNSTKEEIDFITRKLQK